MLSMISHFLVPEIIFVPGPLGCNGSLFSYHGLWGEPPLKVSLERIVLKGLDVDFALPASLIETRDEFIRFLEKELKPHLRTWERDNAVPDDFFWALGAGNWLGFQQSEQGWTEEAALKQALMMEETAKVSPGVAVAYLVQMSLGLKGLYLYGTAEHKKAHLENAIRGETLVCLASTENQAGSDVAAMETVARKVDGGWLLTGSKSWATNGNISDYAVVTAVSDPQAERTRRISMFWVDLREKGVKRRKLNKGVWIPSDLTRITMEDVFVPNEDLMGERGQGMRQVLTIFTHSRLIIAALAVGTAAGAFELALAHAKKRNLFGRRLADLQAKSFEMAELHAQLEAARLMTYKACWTKDGTLDYFDMDAAMAKYLSVEAARRVSTWAADLFGAASVVVDHPIHKFPLDAWAVSLGEGTQDVQKLVIFRKLMEKV